MSKPAKGGFITSGVWHSDRFQALPSDHARLLFLWTITGEHRNGAGIFRFHQGMLPVWISSPKKLNRSLIALETSGLIKFTPLDAIISVQKWFDQMPCETWRHAVNVIDILNTYGVTELTMLRAHEFINQRGFRQLQLKPTASQQRKIDNFNRMFR